ncbi:MAG TPA: hypothetical protein VFL56_03295, partial [Solirubrobacterales bacterium]|nr:hypothetical protein [Solirubrobacterales bacterium]
MSFGDYLQGSIELIAVAAALGYGAAGLRGRLLPGWSGAPARLAEVVLGLSLLVVILELVGVIGLYRPGWVLAASLTAGLGLGFALRKPRQGVAPATPPVGPVALAVALAAALLVAAHWAMPTQTGLDIGMYLPNTTWHNAPFAARFVQDAQVGALHYTEVLDLTVWFYPQNSELLHSAGVLFLGNDFLSPLINIGWMSLCLLAAWSFARPYGTGPVAILAIALVLDANMLLLYQPGDAKNDTAGLFFLLASAAILVNADAQRRAASGLGPAGIPNEAAARQGETGTPLRRGLPAGPTPPTAPALPTGTLLVAGLAAGLALGTKLTVVPPVLALTAGVIFISPTGRRLRASGIWIGAALIGGGYWYLRNLVVSGNPFPWQDIGPIQHSEALQGRDPHSVIHYATDTDVWGKYFTPALHERLGDLWPAYLALAVIAVLLVLWRGGRVERMLGVVAILSFIAYLFTPLSASGPDGMPIGFRLNIRYLAPGLTLALTLLAIPPSFSFLRGREAWWRV